jgi:hypothetical protein
MFLSLGFAGQELFDDFDALCRASEGAACAEQDPGDSRNRPNLMPAL